ncbi:hypothetical protein K5I29_06005 [Flavobacterium agricola]|uniref:Uncharacterized protein n=1 Tax=Flavobacterium agricola TaxID=2870839 RepID=A0ABY6M4B5_9FLAO|nr:hypothetical protein [Flavobacterium agricola]UYW02443.1 hypothetical protein K5I29_06005 [Flavobacterium agricola]
MKNKDLLEIKPKPKHRIRNLILGVVFDLLGNASYLIPGLGEGIDVFWAPLAMYFMNVMYPSKAGKAASIVTFIEEIMPGIDIIPSFTIMWFYTYVYKK